MGPELERNKGRMKGMELQANPRLNTNLALSAPSLSGSLPTREGRDPWGSHWPGWTPAGVSLQQALDQPSTLRAL